MSRAGAMALGALAVALALGGGYWWGERSHRSDGGAGVPVSTAASGAPKAAPAPARKLLYYRNPMGLPDTSPTPKKDPMGMDYIAVYEGEEPAAGSGNEIKIGTEKVQKLGVRTEPVTLRALQRTVKAAGRVEVDERRVYSVSPKFEGWVERLHVNATGQPVAKGQPLFEVYSPELVSAQREYSIALEASAALKGAGDDPRAGMKRLAESSLARLKNWDISEEQIRALETSGESRRTLTFRSPVSGIVMEKKALQGMRFMPGESLFQVADLSSLWVIAEVFEQDIALVQAGSRARVRIGAYPGQAFDGLVTYLYPTLKPETRTVPIRIEIANPGGRLKPAMFAEVELAAGGKEKVLTIPTSAVIDSGARRIVLVQRGEGRFEPRPVTLGGRSETHVQVLEGLGEGEQVVVAANFLIDAESNLKAAIGGFGLSAQGDGTRASGTGGSAVGHRAEGRVESLDAAQGTVAIEHGPVESLKWPGMNMEFKVANPSLLAGLAPGKRVAFEFVERSPGEWVITKIAPGSGPTNAPARDAPGAHQGH